MAEIKITGRSDGEYTSHFAVAAEDENGAVLSSGGFRITDTRYGAGYIRTLTAGGISTPVENRRGGNIRKMFDYMHRFGYENGAAVSILHPFSFAYYRLFGYEKVSEHRMVRFPTRLLDFVPRRCTLVKYSEDEQKKDLIDIYERFSEGRNLMISRRDGCYFDKARQTYIAYEDGKPAAYIIFHTKNSLIINHMGDGLLTVEEMAYTSPSSMRELLSFLRMFEGEMDEVEFWNCALNPELELMLRHYTHTSYTLVPDIMARVLNPEIMLRANDYPDAPGAFTVRLEDDLEFVRGVYSVTYGGGKCDVKKSGYEAQADVTMDSRAFTRVLYGGVDERSAGYMDGVTFERPCPDLFRALPLKPVGVFEHF